MFYCDDCAKANAPLPRVAADNLKMPLGAADKSADTRQTPTDPGEELSG
jgi:hypothetical protein